MSKKTRYQGSTDIVQYFDSTLIDHGHRKELRLCIREYCVVMELAKTAALPPEKRASFVCDLLSIAPSSFGSIVEELKTRGHLYEKDGRIIIAAKWYETAEKYFRTHWTAQ